MFAITMFVDGWEAAVPCLERMVEIRSFYLPYCVSAPRFRPLRADPRFQAVMEKVFPGIAIQV